MLLLSLPRVGLIQTWASVVHGTWYARSAEFMQTPAMENRQHAILAYQRASAIKKLA
jgi:nitric oxide reductase large subunit